PRAPAPGQSHACSSDRHSGLRQLPPARLCLPAASAADSCWGLTPSERAAAASVGDEESARPAANSGWSAALTRAVLACSVLATAATIASWPCFSDGARFSDRAAGFLAADTVFAWTPGLVPAVDATAAAVLPAARAAVTAAAAAIALVRLRMRILLGFRLAATEPGETHAGRRRSLTRLKNPASRHPQSEMASRQRRG